MRVRAYPFPPEDPEIPRISDSRMNVYDKCGHRYYLKYIEDMRFVRIAAASGLGIHEGGKADSTEKMSGRDDGLPISQVVEAAVAAYDQEIQSGNLADPASEVAGGRDITASGAGAFKGAVSPTIKVPHLIEAPLNVYRDTPLGKVEVVAVLDLVDEEAGRRRIRDLKTSKRRKTAAWAHGSDQLTGQGYVYQSKTGQAPESYIIDALTYSKRAGWTYEQLKTDRTQEDFESWWARSVAILKGIKAGSFPPAPEGSWYCSPGWCEFWAICPFVASRRRHQKEDS